MQWEVAQKAFAGSYCLSVVSLKDALSDEVEMFVDWRCVGNDAFFLFREFYFFDIFLLNLPCEYVQ